MTLDLSQVVAQVGSLTQALKAAIEEKGERLHLALNTLHRQHDQEAALRHKLGTAKTTWLVAEPKESLEATHPTPPCPAEFTVLAVDGSHIDVDRHSPARCYLINIGIALLHYGSQPRARLTSHPSLFLEEDDLVLRDPLSGRQEPVEGALLGIKRTLEEAQALAQGTATLAEPGPLLALMDGSLILWGLSGQAYPDFVKEALLTRGFIPFLEEMRRLAGERPLALASYISLPRSTEVVNLLRLALCPYEPVSCDRCQDKKPGSRDCDGVGGLQDRDLFQKVLKNGERSPVFGSLSSIVTDYYERHQIHFFYVNAGQEIGRVEVPRWVAENPARLDLVHALVVDQCGRGQGYPVALMEAHEKAVVTAGDREQFWNLVERALLAEGLPTATSAKSQSKRTKWV